MASTIPRPKDLRPCDNCRHRKIRCLFASDNAVNCVLCESRSTTCTYVQKPPVKKRALSKDHHDKVTSPTQRHHPYQPTSQAPARPKKKANYDAPVVRDYTRLPGRSLLKETLGHQNRQSSSVLGATADFDPCLLTSLRWDERETASSFRPPQTLRRANGRTHFFLRPDTQDEMDAELAALDSIEQFVSPHGPELVKIYFRIVHPTFPILHKNVFLEKYGRSYRESTPIGLGAVYVLALNWWSYSQALSALPKPDAKELEARVLRMLTEAHRRPKISDLQGGLVLMQSPNVDSWAMTGHLVAMAQNLGINADCTDWQVPAWEKGVRKRVAWALFMQDKWGALIYGRGSHIRSEDWDVQPLQYSDFPETAKDDDNEEGSAEIEKGKLTFLNMVSLTQILAQILDEFFTLKALRTPRTLPSTLEAAKPLQLQLRGWHAKIPPELSLDNTVPMKLSSVGYLHLAYYTAETTLHRAIMRCHPSASFSYSTPNSARSPFGDEQNDHLQRISLHAAEARFVSALDFVRRLKAEHFQSFWYFSSSVSLAIIGIFAAVLHGAAPNRADRERYLAKLAEYRWVLRISANSAPFMRYAVDVLDACNQALEEQASAEPATSTDEGARGPGEASVSGAEDGDSGQGQALAWDTGDAEDPDETEFLSSVLGNGTDWLQSLPGNFQYDDLGTYQQTPTT
ncbi:fungal specific transcription factor domain-containing protein [Sarocladium implicatum]|nr:fungal specific transcription factor domain-containing protein [Sarocladium implicatum]